MEEKYFLSQIKDTSFLKPFLDLVHSDPTSSHISEAYLNWQYNTNPSGIPVAYVAIEKITEDFVSQYLILPQKYCINGNENHIGMLSLNTLTREDYRGRGLFPKMAELAYTTSFHNGDGFVIGIPNPNSYRGFVNKLNFKHTGDLSLLIKPYNLFNIVAIKLFKGSQKHGDDLIPKEFTFSNSNKIFTVDKFDPAKDLDEYEAFWDQYKNQYPVLTSRSLPFLKWRFSAPDRNYQLYKVTGKDGKIHAYCALRAKSVYGIKNGFVVDFCCLNNGISIKAGAFLIKSINRIFRKLKMDMAGAAMVGGALEKKLLLKGGFYICPKALMPQPLPFIIRTNPDFELANVVEEFSNWFFTMADYDVI